MKNSDLLFLVIGAGAVGGISAAYMRKNGVDVEILCKSEEYARLISEKGLIIKGARGSFSERIHAYPLNGYIVRNARANGIKVPVNEAVVNIINEIETKKRFISVDNFNDPVFNRFN